MRLAIRHWVALAIVSLALSGCAVWTKLDGGSLTHAGVTVSAPADWMHLAANRDVLMITRDGIGIQHISAAFLTGDKLFPKTKQTLSNDVQPQELAQRVVGELRQQPEMSGVEIKNVAPATVAGKPGFRALLEWRNDRGASFQRIVAGSAMDGGLFLVQYHALKRHFYERDLKAFDSVLASAKRG
jgi:hypothetical protein